MKLINVTTDGGTVLVNPANINYISDAQNGRARISFGGGDEIIVRESADAIVDRMAERGVLI